MFDRGVQLKLAWQVPALVLLLAAPVVAQPDHFVVRVEDKDTGEPLGCATLTTTGNIVYTSDDNGVVAIYEPGLMGKSVFFTPQREGYFYPADFLGIAGEAFDLVAGGSATLEMTRDGDPGSCHAGLEGSQLASGPVPAPSERFRIEVREQGSGRPVPLVFVRSPRREHVSDSGGLVAFYDPAMMGRTVFFEIDAHGYDLVDADGDGGVWLTPTAGQSVMLEVAPRRDQIAQRLYRLTGGGVYRDTLLLGEQAPTARPVVNGLVMGQDTVFSTLYKGRPFYIWGDTNKPSYPLGNFKVSGATSRLPEGGGLDPRVGVDLDYFTDATGFTKELAPEETVPNPPGEDDFLATWLGGLVTAPSPDGEERLFASYGMFEFLFAREKGLVRWDDDDELFHKIVVLPEDAPLVPHGPAQVIRHSDGEFVQYHNGVRVPRSEMALRDPDRYQGFTPFLERTLELDRDQQGRLRYAWREATRIVDQELLDQGLEVDSGEVLFGHVAEFGGTRRPLVHENGSTAWNDYRRRYVRTILENFGGPSFLGEIWFAEADTPMGPWVYARKVVTHDGYSFYNPMHHPFFDQRGGRDIFFEGTYTTLFSSEEPTARYDYNQIMYRLDLTDPRLRLPVPVYDLDGAGELATKAGVRRGMTPGPAVFMAWDRPHAEGVPVYWSGAACEVGRVLHAAGRPSTPPIFWAAASGEGHEGTVPLHAFVAGDGRLRDRSAAAEAMVWPNPIVVDLPVADYLADLLADAGSDQCVVEDEPGTGATVTLDASRSDHAAGVIVDYRWSSWPEGRLLATGPSPRVALAAGLHTIVLETFDERGRSSRDEVTIRVEAAGGGR